uniref:Uncharacterized protein n=1 Tax=Caenorhabditis tropicalis TaxID=1561998 RepID=A0A1I7UL07_9PELO
MSSKRRLDHSDAFDQNSDSTTPKILLLSPEQLMFDYTNGIFLNGSSMHHSFDDRPSASSEDLFASCNDIDNAIEQSSVVCVR